MQLAAYCHLIEMNYKIRPTHGVIKYPEKEFTIAYTDTIEQSLTQVVRDILMVKQSQYEEYFTSSSIGICYKCKTELLVGVAK
jgi:CRISPR/Cas system-associated exonuclease Cas4 (RecB family)